MKKALSVFLILLIGLTLFSGCAEENKTQRTTQIPENGIISREVFQDIKENDDIGIFNGNNNDITYQWLFIGSTITQSKDENLNVNFSNAKTEEIKTKLSVNHVQEFSFESDEEFDGSPSLSVYFAVPWEADSAEIYRYASDLGEPVLVSTVALENSPNAIVTFIPKEYKGLFYIVGVKTEGTDKTVADYTSKPQNAVTDTKNNEKDKYLTDPIPEGKPQPVEPEEVTVTDSKKYTCTLSIKCTTILDNMDSFNKDKLPVLPQDGVIMATRTVVFSEGESVFDVLKRETRNSKIHMESVFTPIYNSAYVEGINNLYEFDCGELSGWMYKVNGWFPNYGCSRYMIQNGDVIEWVYTCDLGRDVGGYFLTEE